MQKQLQAAHKLMDITVFQSKFIYAKRQQVTFGLWVFIAKPYCRIAVPKVSSLKRVQVKLGNTELK